MERTPKREWNTGASIPISSLSQDELKEAIHEWAEGSKELEDVLWACYKNDVVTIGSHVDPSETGRFYIQFIVDESNRRNLEKLVFESYKTKNAGVDFQFNGNPFSGAAWNKPTVSIGTAYPCNTHRYLFNLVRVFDGEYEYEYFVPKSPCLKIFELYDLLKSKRWPLSVSIKRISYVENLVVITNDMYKVENNPIRDIFEKSGYRTYSSAYWNGSIHQCWSFVSMGHKGLMEDMDRLIKVLSEVAIDELPAIDESIMTEHYVLYLKSIEFGNSREGIEKMNDWINSHKYFPDQEDVHY